MWLNKGRGAVAECFSGRERTISQKIIANNCKKTYYMITFEKLRTF